MTPIKAISGKFAFHVDPMYYGFQWTEAQYITVDYTAIKREDSVVASVYSIAVAPWLLGSITMRGNWMAVDKEISEAAQNAAVKEFEKQIEEPDDFLTGIHPTIASALAPHIKA